MALRRAGLLAFLLAVLAAVAGAAFLAWDWHTPYGAPGEARVTIRRGMHAGEVAETLHRAGRIRFLPSFKIAFVLYGKPRRIRPGTYHFERPMSPLEVLDKLNRGDVELVRVTIPEGLTLDQAADLLADAGIGRREAFLAAFRDVSPLEGLDPRAEDLEGYLFPETYRFDPGLSERAVAETLVKAFRSFWAREGLPSGKPVRETVTLASLVEKETAAPEERPVVAGVFENRLRLRMPLQTDPSVLYALRRAGLARSLLLREDWGFESPYNTYRILGLPPGPICSPGRASLEAALHPQKTPYLYFVSRNDGTHAFSRTLEEHNAWVARTRKGRNGGGGRR